MEGVGSDNINARYYDGARGQFTSQDPVHNAVGDSAQLKNLIGQDLRTYLMNPQQLNSYSYAGNNPIVNKDPTGLWAAGLNIGVSIELGAGFYIGGTLNTGVYLIVDNQTGEISFARADTVGGAVGIQGGPSISSAGSVPENGGVLGATVSVGLSGTYDGNVNKPFDLNGVTNNKSVSALMASGQVSESPNGLESYTIGGGVKPIGSVSNYPTRTQVKDSFSAGSVNLLKNSINSFISKITNKSKNR